MILTSREGSFSVGPYFPEEVVLMIDSIVKDVQICRPGRYYYSVWNDKLSIFSARTDAHNLHCEETCSAYVCNCQGGRP